MFKIIYLVTMVVAGFTGFAQMPIMRRYYINEAPFLSWSADFYATLVIHYIAAAILLALTSYAVVDFILTRRSGLKLTGTGAVRAGLMTGLVVSGAGMVIKHLPGVNFGQDFIIVLDLAHMGLAMVFMLFALGCLIARAKWTRPVLAGTVSA